MPSWLFTLLQVRRRLWFTVALYSGLGVAAALVAARFGRYVPSDFPLKLGSDAVDDLLSILASSMLAVATFSLATLVTAYTSVVGAISPHAARLLVSVGAIRNTLATFIGAFVYAMVGIVALHTGYYGAEGRVILFFVTVAVLVGVIVAMLRWIGELSNLGQAGNVIDRVADATAEALRAPLSLRRAATASPPQDALAVYAERLGYVQNIDIKGLERSARTRGARIFLCVQPGDFVHGGAPLLWASGPPLDAACVRELHDRVTLGPERTHEQDPRYGMRVLGEIAARALSPGVNDAGTARDVISRAVILLRDWAVGNPVEDAPDALEVVTRPALAGRLLLEEAVGPIIQHGAAHPGLQVELQHALAGLAALPDPEIAAAAWQVSRDALAQSSRSIARQADRRRVHEAAMRVLAAARPSARDETFAPRVPGAR